MNRFHSLCSAFAMACVCSMGFSGTASAEWPERAVTIIVPWGAGGGTDATARAVAQQLEKRFRQPFNIVNRTGGGGLTGHMAFAKAPADGYTLGITTVEMTMYKAQGIKGISPEDFTFIGRYNADAVGLNVKADAPYTTAKDLIEAVKANPGAIKASGGNRGGMSHLAWAGLLNELKIDPNASPWVASDGATPALQQLAAGAIQLVSTSPAEAQSLVDAGEVRTLAVVSNERNAAFPDIPSMPEAFDVKWSPMPFRALAGPKGLPEDVVRKVSDALKEVTEDEEFIAFMTARGFSIAYQDSRTFTETVNETTRNVTDAMKAVGLAQ